MLRAIPGGERWLLTQELAMSGISIPLRKHLRYAKVKGKYLVFVFIHPLALQEFKMQKEQIKEKLRIFYKEKLNLLKAHSIIFSDIHAIVIMPKTQEIKQIAIDYTFPEKSKGNFVNRVRDKSLHKLFEDIRENIKNNKSKSLL
jgi:hypothetical protein